MNSIRTVGMLSIVLTAFSLQGKQELTRSSNGLEKDGIPIDFEISMGKGDAYMDSYYNLFLEDIGSFSGHIRPLSSIDLLNLCRNTYSKYRFSSFPDSERDYRFYSSSSDIRSMY
jgi:hypothetical protein